MLILQGVLPAIGVAKVGLVVPRFVQTNETKHLWRYNQMVIGRVQT